MYWAAHSRATLLLAGPKWSERTLQLLSKSRGRALRHSDKLDVRFTWRRLFLLITCSLESPSLIWKEEQHSWWVSVPVSSLRCNLFHLLNLFSLLLFRLSCHRMTVNAPFILFHSIQVSDGAKHCNYSQCIMQQILELYMEMTYDKRC